MNQFVLQMGHSPSNRANQGSSSIPGAGVLDSGLQIDRQINTSLLGWGLSPGLRFTRGEKGTFTNYVSHRQTSTENSTMPIIETFTREKL